MCQVVTAYATTLADCKEGKPELARSSLAAAVAIHEQRLAQLSDQERQELSRLKSQTEAAVASAGASN
jgi:hypothetical protein